MSIFWELRGFLRENWRSYGIAALLLIAVALLALLPPVIIGAVVDRILHNTLDRQQLLWHVAAILACALGIYICRVLWRQILYGASYTLSLRLRRQIYAHLLQLSPTALRDFSAGDLMARATNDVQAVEMCAGEAVLSIFDGLLTGLLVLGVMIFAFSGWLTLMALAPWPLMSWAMWRLGTALHSRFDGAQAAFSDLNALAQESIAGLRALRGLGAENHAIGLLRQASDAANAASFRVAQIDARYDPIIYLTVGASFLISIGGGAWLIDRGELSVGGLTSFTLYLGHLVWPMFAFGWMASLVQRGKASWERIQQFLQTPSGVSDDGSVSCLEGARLEFAVDGFCYAGRTRPALQDVRFRVEAGSTLGIVGPTGAGKSTLLALIARLYAADGVKVRIGGHDAADYTLDALRSGVAYVMQEAVLFSATLRENLTMARPDASEEDIARVLRIAALETDIATFPAGMDTAIGERGVTLSGGQRQRVCLARALLSDAAILLIDDALSAVDAETEHHILGELERHTRQLSRIIVSHRLSAVQSAEEILVLRDGLISERGNHASLLAMNGWYAETWRYQQLATEVVPGA